MRQPLTSEFRDLPTRPRLRADGLPTQRPVNRQVIAGICWGSACIAAGLFASDWHSLRSLAYLAACVGFVVLGAVVRWGTEWLRGTPSRAGQPCGNCGHPLSDEGCWHCDTPV